MDIKHTKCAATGKLYNSIKNNAALAGINLNNTLKHQLNTLRLDSHSIPYLPPSTPYKYRGIWINMDLNWNEHFHQTATALKNKGDKLLTSNLPLKIKIEMLQKIIRPSATYAFPLAIYTKSQIDSLDCLLAQYGKRVMGLPNTFPTTAMLLPKEKGGLGLISYHVDYKQHNITQLTKILNDTGRLGKVSRALLQYHHKRYTGSTTTQQDHTHIHYRLNTSLRQLQLATAADIQWIHSHTPYCPLHTTEFTAWQQQWNDNTPDNLAIPHRAMEVLWTLGITSIQALVDTTHTSSTENT